MPLTVLSIAYPLARVGPNAIGGAEQVLAHLDRALEQAGHHSIVVACDGSQVRGTLLSYPEAQGVLDESALKRAEHGSRCALESALAQWPVDVVHIHAVNHARLLPSRRVPTLVTLHLPREYYASADLKLAENTWLHCVSRAQHNTMPNCEQMLDPIENGVSIPATRPHAKRRFALTMGRICPEKGIHLAIDACNEAAIPLVIGGQVFGYETHQQYFREQVVPRLKPEVRFVGPLHGARKHRLLVAAQCVLISSTVDETSSLLAREALAAGTPVVAFRRGALVDVIDEGVTGFLVDDVSSMALAIHRTAELDPEICRARAKERFSEARMIREYFAVYYSLASVRSAALAGAR